MTSRQKRTLLRILLSAALLAAAALLPVKGLLRLAVFLVPYLLVGWDVLRRAGINIIHGQVFDENFLMALATLGAFGVREYPEAVFVMLFYQVGELFQSCAVGKSRRSIAALMDIRPDYANLEEDGQLRQVDPEEVAVGALIVVRPGERIPLDGVVAEGASSIDTAALTGEPVPRDVAPGDEVVSGCVNLSGVLRITVSRPFAQSTVSKILDLMENASERKATAENFITKFARYYTPAVVIAALLLAFLPPLLTTVAWQDSISRALNFLVVSCPCALVISVPLSFFGGIGGASRAGILVKGGNYLEALARAEMVVFDKTGTLTRGVFQVASVHPEGCTREELLETAALAECWSNHPISRSLREAWGSQVDAGRVQDGKEVPGLGVEARVDGHIVLAGNHKLMQQAGIACSPASLPGTVVYVARDGLYLGYLVISDQVKPEAAQAIAQLKQLGVRKTVMLTGDNAAAGQAVGDSLGLDQVRAQLLPAQKVEQVEALLKEVSPKGQLVYVGDGINDAPVLSRADVGIAMGAMGSDAAIEAADVVLMDDTLSKLPQAITIARRTLTIVHQNIIFALGVKLLVLALSAAGLSNLWEAVFADVGVSVIAILNAMRTLRSAKTPS